MSDWIELLQSATRHEIPAGYQTAAEIAKETGRRSIQAVRETLHELAKQGKAEEKRIGSRWYFKQVKGKKV